MSRDPVIVLDYGAGNLKSVENALTHLGAPCRVTSNPSDVENASCVIFPGDGEATASMNELTRTGLGSALRAYVASGRKMLGICIGAQVIFDRSEERDTECLHILPGTVRLIPSAPGIKVPHMGWNPVHFTVRHPVFEGVPQDSSLYFVHSYYPSPSDPDLVAGTTDHGIPFTACVARSNLIAFQCHIEKSGPVGLRLVRNFLDWDGKWDGGSGRHA
jgi:imidazole glycerol-phosphate synthase subunit HisH